MIVPTGTLCGGQNTWSSLRVCLVNSEQRKYIRGIKALKAKDRRTIIFCVNAAGTRKFPPLTAGSAKIHHCFRESRPLQYISQATAYPCNDIGIFTSAAVRSKPNKWLIKRRSWFGMRERWIFYRTWLIERRVFGSAQVRGFRSQSFTFSPEGRVCRIGRYRVPSFRH